MQEDNISKRIAFMLRKHQEENPLRYDLGSWEAFEKKRNAKSKRKSLFWITGVAASLTIVVLVGGLWFSQMNGFDTSKKLDKLAVEKGTDITSTENSNTEININSEPSVKVYEEEIKASDSNVSVGLKENQPSVIISQSISKKLQLAEREAPDQISENLINEEVFSKSDLIQALIIQIEEKEDESKLKSEILGGRSITDRTELPKNPQLTDAEIRKILETPSSARLAIGVAPGYGGSQNNTRANSGSSLGLGVMVDMDVVGKLAVGSGLAVNYLNQASESQSYAQIAGFSSPVTEKMEITQYQVDIPLFFRYPISRSHSISVQMGFSNLITFNQSAETQTSYTRQVAVLDPASTSSNSITLKSESVEQVSALEVGQNRFYPLATANIGMNFRLFETKNTNYELMPFYNYPLQEISGYGEKLGIFGAAIKVNFGAIQGK